LKNFDGCQQDGRSSYEKSADPERIKCFESADFRNRAGLVAAWGIMTEEREA